MKVILQKDVEKVGTIGQILNVADGFARNYLLPKGLALRAAENNVAHLEHQKKALSAKINKEKKDAEKFALKLSELSCTIAKKVGENEKLFGSVTSADIEEALAKEGVEVSRKNIVLEEPIKALGVYTVLVKLPQAVDANLKVWVVEG